MQKKGVNYKKEKETPVIGEPQRSARVKPPPLFFPPRRNGVHVAFDTRYVVGNAF